MDLNTHASVTPVALTIKPLPGQLASHEVQKRPENKVCYVVINPHHPEFERVIAAETVDVLWDPRVI